MKTTLGKKARLLALAALIAVLPLGIWACEDSGDGPDGPTGPATQYNPQMDYPDATISAKVSTSPVAPGAIFGILATFKDANGLPVEGVPLAIVAEDGGAGAYFNPQTNPTLTDGSGKASIGIEVDPGCPVGSYRFMIAPLRGAQVRGYVGVEVKGTPIVVVAPTASGATIKTDKTSYNVGDVPIITLSVTASSSCDVWFVFQAVGAGISESDTHDATLNSWGFTLGPPDYPTATPSSPGSLTITASAYCDVSGVIVSQADATLTVQVNAAP